MYQVGIFLLVLLIIYAFLLGSGVIEIEKKYTPLSILAIYVVLVVYQYDIITRQYKSEKGKALDGHAEAAGTLHARQYQMGQLPGSYADAETKKFQEHNQEQLHDLELDYKYKILKSLFLLNILR